MSDTFDPPAGDETAPEAPVEAPEALSGYDDTVPLVPFEADSAPNVIVAGAVETVDEQASFNSGRADLFVGLPADAITGVTVAGTAASFGADDVPGSAGVAALWVEAVGVTGEQTLTIAIA